MKTEKETLLEELIESSKSQEDKLATARVIAHKDGVPKNCQSYKKFDEQEVTRG